MSFPTEGVESAIRHHIDDVRAFLDAHHRGDFAVYNLAGVRLRAGDEAEGPSMRAWLGVRLRVWRGGRLRGHQ